MSSDINMVRLTQLTGDTKVFEGWTMWIPGIPSLDILVQAESGELSVLKLKVTNVAQFNLRGGEPNQYATGDRRSAEETWQEEIARTLFFGNKVIIYGAKETYMVEFL